MWKTSCLLGCGLDRDAAIKPEKRHVVPIACFTNASAKLPSATAMTRILICLF